MAGSILAWMWNQIPILGDFSEQEEESADATIGIASSSLSSRIQTVAQYESPTNDVHHRASRQLEEGMNYDLQTTGNHNKTRNTGIGNASDGSGATNSTATQKPENSIIISFHTAEQEKKVRNSGKKTEIPEVQKMTTAMREQDNGEAGESVHATEFISQESREEQEAKYAYIMSEPLDIFISGLPASGKSKLAKHLAPILGATQISKPNQSAMGIPERILEIPLDKSKHFRSEYTNMTYLTSSIPRTYRFMSLVHFICQQVLDYALYRAPNSRYTIVECSPQEVEQVYIPFVAERNELESLEKQILQDSIFPLVQGLLRRKEGIYNRFKLFLFLDTDPQLCFKRIKKKREVASSFSSTTSTSTSTSSPSESNNNNSGDSSKESSGNSGKDAVKKTQEEWNKSFSVGALHTQQQTTSLSSVSSQPFVATTSESAQIPPIHVSSSVISREDWINQEDYGFAGTTDVEMLMLAKYYRRTFSDSQSVFRSNNTIIHITGIPEVSTSTNGGQLSPKDEEKVNKSEEAYDALVEHIAATIRRAIELRQQRMIRKFGLQVFARRFGGSLHRHTNGGNGALMEDQEDGNSYDPATSGGEEDDYIMVAPESGRSVDEEFGYSDPHHPPNEVGRNSDQMNLLDEDGVNSVIVQERVGFDSVLVTKKHDFLLLDEGNESKISVNSKED
jgi:hypothetical protein